MRTAAQIESTIKVLESQAGAIRGKAEGRDLSTNEKRSLATLEAEIDAMNEELEEVRGRESGAAERRAQTVAEVAGGAGTVVRGFGPDFGAGNPTRVIADSTAQRTATATEERQMSDLRAFLRGELRASMTSVNGNGGYLLPNPAVERVIDLVKDADPFLARARVFQLSGQATSIEVPVQSADGAVSWVAETTARPETNSPTFGVQTIQAFEAYGNWMATQTMLDSQPYIESWIIEEVSKSLLQAGGAKFAVGAGTTEIFGAFANVVDGYHVELSGSAAALVNTVFPAAFYALSAVYHPNAAWVMAPATLATVSGFTWPNLADTPLVSYDGNGEPRIMGKPVLLCDNAPAIEADAYPVFFGDISAAYGIAIHQDVNVLRDPYTNKPYVGFYGTLRVGGNPLDNQAGVLIQCAEEASV